MKSLSFAFTFLSALAVSELALAKPVIRTEARPWGTDYTLVTNDGTNDVVLVSVRPKCVKYASQMANMYSDDGYGVAVRAWDLRDEMIQGDGVLKVVVPGGRIGATASVIEGPREVLAERLAAAGRAHGAAMNRHGGPMSASSDLTRQSYVFAEVTAASCDDDIELARRAGIGIIHFYGWWASLGHYPVHPKLYPGGLADFKACVDRVHAAGLKAGMHTLSGCIDFKDPCFGTPSVGDLQSVARYSLVGKLTADAKELTVREKPVSTHDRVMTYSGNGNVLRIGRELIEYSDFTLSPPYRFTGLIRGKFGSPATEHLDGEPVDYVRQRYLAFYPEPGTKLADEVAMSIANVCNSCGIDQVYFDGSEGMGTRYNVDWMRNRMFRALGRDAVVEASCLNAHNWYFHSRLNAWDYPFWGLNKFNDLHYAVNEPVCKADILRPQMGWWFPCAQGSRAHRGHMLEELEYMMGKTAALDSSFAMAWIDYGSTSKLLQTTVVGWYERFRLARAFSERALRRFRTRGAESRLRQDADGVWRVQEVVRDAHRVNCKADASWSVSSEVEVPAAVRVESLYEVDESANGVVILPAGRFPSKSWDFPYFNAGDCEALSFDVTGDGSGRTLVFTLTTPREFTKVKSEHRVKVDFTGKRRVTVFLRERDAAADEPLNMRYAVYRNALKVGRIGSVSFRWDGDADGEPLHVGEVTCHPAKRVKTSQASLAVNGAVIPVPFDLTSGESAVLEAGEWIHYSEANEPVERKDGPSLVLRAGANACEWRGNGRTEIAFTQLGGKFDALKSGAAPLDYAYQAPQLFRPANGFAAIAPLAVANGDKRDVRIEMQGSAVRPVVSIGAGEWRFPVTLADGDRLSCLDGVNWKVADTGRVVRASGRLDRPLPTIVGTTPVAVKTDDDANADLRILLSTRRRR